VFVILPNSRSPILQKRGYPPGRVGISENWGFVAGTSNCWSIDTLTMGRLMGKYSAYKKTPVKTEA